MDEKTAKRLMLANIQGMLSSKEQMRVEILQYVDQLVDQKLEELQPGQGLGIVLRLEILNPQDGRNTPDYVEWRKAVFARDNYTCTECGGRGYLQAHHIKSWEDYPDLRLAVDNGQTLCVPCHEEKHPHLKLIGKRRKRKDG